MLFVLVREAREFVRATAAENGEGLGHGDCVQMGFWYDWRSMVMVARQGVGKKVGVVECCGWLTSGMRRYDIIYFAHS